MRGHTADGVLRACLKSVYLASRERRDRETIDESLRNYWEGQMRACVQIGISLYVIDSENDLVPPGAPA
ncbi:hypothetical protein [Burkholderia gladioli]|uniref:hypothetical protein n=1 Tax=Burkholderia gladioli TaxID=28095 RepID=UPI00163FD778|nr:hypothetical protein [Burkholderia gladioli]